MTQRPTLDQMTSDDLDQLHAEVDRLGAELTDYEERVHQLEDLLRIAHETSNKSEAERARTAAELEQAQATIKRVRTLLAGRWGTVDPDRVRAALTPQDTP